MKAKSSRTKDGKFRVEITRSDGSRVVYQTDYQHPFLSWPDWECIEGIPCPDVINRQPARA
jgi:hypothetical protein